MKLEEMSAEELVNDSIHNPATEALRANKAELLRRLSEGERAKTRLEQDATNWKILWDGAQEEIERLKKENEELAQYNWKLLSENSGFSNLVADLKKEVENGKKELEGKISKCVCGHYHCPICGNQMEMTTDATWQSDQLTRKER